MKPELQAEDETELTFVGLCGFSDPPRPTAAGALSRLRANGIRLKILFGDDPVIVKRLAALAGVNADRNRNYASPRSSSHSCLSFDAIGAE